MEQEVMFTDWIEGVESIETPAETESNVYEVAYDLGWMMESFWNSVCPNQPFDKEKMLEAFAEGLDSAK